VTGAALRVLAIISWWPATMTLGDNYEAYTSNPFENPVHPGGYSLIMAALGLVTREIAALILLQHLTGIASALLLWAATRRVTGSPWAGLLPGGIVLLDPDFIFLEHSIMSESWIVLGISAGLYAAVRALDEPEPHWRWPLLTSVTLSLTVTIRTAALFMIPVASLALLLYRPRSFAGRRAYRRAALTVVGASAAILLAFATTNTVLGERFGLGASPGWYLYARAAQFADCTRFTPPDGTEVLCEERPASERPGTRYYVFDPTAPAPRFFGLGNQDDLLARWAMRAILAQPRDYLHNVWTYLRAYWFPDLRPNDSTLSTDPWQIEQGLDPQLAFTNGLYSSGLYQKRVTQRSVFRSLRDILAFVESLYQQSLERFYNDFTVHKYVPGLEFLRHWQQVVRFGASALWITTVLVALGVAIGTRPSRVGVLLFGIGGLTLILARR